MDYKLCVIIPVFNAAQHISKCCESLFSQTLNSIEYIFVNDGSTDNSVLKIEEVLLSFPSRKKSVKIISREDNKGVAYTRQEGVNASTGEYVIHCDADDWVEPNMYELIYNKAKEDNADVVCCGYFVDTPKGSSELLPKDDYKIGFNISPIYGSLWNRVIRRNFFSNKLVEFVPGINWGEDFMVATKCHILANKVSVIRKPLYHYVQNESSITHNISLNKLYELLRCGKEMEKFLLEHDLLEKYSFELNYLKFQVKSYLLTNSQLFSPKLWKTIYPECHKSLFDFNCSFYLKLSSWFLIHHLTPLAKIILQSRILLNRIRQ